MCPFSRNYRSTVLENMDVCYNGTRLETVNTVSFLGIDVDRNLNFESHIEKLRLKLIRSLFAIQRLKHNVSNKSLRMLYTASFESYLRFGILVWGNKNTSVKIFRFQKKVVRILAGAGINQTCRPLFKELRVLTLPSLFIYESLVYIHRNTELLQCNTDIHKYNTRTCENIFVQRSNTSLGRDRPSYLAIKLYNKLPSNLKSLKKVKML